MNIIVERQSGNWNSENYKTESASTGLAYKLYGSSSKALEFEQYTLELHKLWASSFTIPFAECRHFLRTLAHSNWKQVRGCTGIFIEKQHEEVSQMVFGDENSWVLFTDDDDWYSPNVFDTLQQTNPNPTYSGVLWPRGKFDGEFLLKQNTPSPPAPFLAYTNNYAIQAKSIPANTRVSDVMQHSYADTMFKSRQWPFILLDNDVGLSITNKTPCSWNYLHKAYKSANPTVSLIQFVEHYAYSEPVIPSEFLWANSYIKNAQEFFRDILK